MKVTGRCRIFSVKEETTKNGKTILKGGLSGSKKVGDDWKKNFSGYATIIGKAVEALRGIVGAEKGTTIEITNGELEFSYEEDGKDVKGVYVTVYEASIVDANTPSASTPTSTTEDATDDVGIFGGDGELPDELPFA